MFLKLSPSWFSASGVCQPMRSSLSAWPDPVTCVRVHTDSTYANTTPELSLSSYFFNAVLTWRIPCQEKMQITSPSSIEGLYKLVQEKFNLSLYNRNQAGGQLIFVFQEKGNMLSVKLYLWLASSVPLGLRSRPRKGPRQLRGLHQRGAFEGWLLWVTEGLQEMLRNTAPSLTIQHGGSSHVTGQKLPERRTWRWGGGRGKEGCFMEELESDHRGMEA